MPGLIPAAFQQLSSVLDGFTGVGPKAAARMTQQLLLQPGFANDLAGALEQASKLVLCPNCRVMTLAADYRGVSEKSGVAVEGCLCCLNPEHHHDSLLILLDEASAEKAFEAGYSGQIWLLHRLLSPIDRIGPDDIDCSGLIRRLKSLKAQSPGFSAMVVLPESVEGRATALFLSRLIENQEIVLVQPEFEGLLVSKNDSEVSK